MSSELEDAEAAYEAQIQAIIRLGETDASVAEHAAARAEGRRLAAELDKLRDTGEWNGCETS